LREPLLWLMILKGLAEGGRRMQALHKLDLVVDDEQMLQQYIQAPSTAPELRGTF
jgi:hypothetical protein